MEKQEKNVIYVKVPDRNAWMVTFSDMVTLLITFFVLLISMTSLDDKALKELFGFFNEVMGPIEFPQTQEMSGVPLIMDIVTPKLFFDAMTLNKSLLDSLDSRGVGGLTGRGPQPMEVREINRGMAILLNSEILFDVGSSQLKREAEPVLMGIAEVIRNSGSLISVEGHTDNRGSPEMNWRLSLSRAIRILDYFVYTAGMSPTNFCVVGYGPSRPVASNATDEGRSQNRRVEIIILKDLF
ncbi:MAG: flagellar motor protein MotB [Desulfomonilia bacterium]|nr:flagellar motor protein MotB [Desulfomonilia bacterium]